MVFGFERPSQGGGATGWGSTGWASTPAGSSGSSGGGGVSTPAPAPKKDSGIVLTSSLIKGGQEAEKTGVLPSSISFANVGVKGAGGTELFDYYVSPSGSVVEVFSAEKAVRGDLPVYRVDAQGNVTGDVIGYQKGLAVSYSREPMITPKVGEGWSKVETQGGSIVYAPSVAGASGIPSSVPVSSSEQLYSAMGTVPVSSSQIIQPSAGLFAREVQQAQATVTPINSSLLSKEQKPVIQVASSAVSPLSFPLGIGAFASSTKEQVEGSLIPLAPSGGTVLGMGLKSRYTTATRELDTVRKSVEYQPFYGEQQGPSLSSASYSLFSTGTTLGKNIQKTPGELGYFGVNPEYNKLLAIHQVKELRRIEETGKLATPTVYKYATPESAREFETNLANLQQNRFSLEASLEKSLKSEALAEYEKKQASAHPVTKFFEERGFQISMSPDTPSFGEIWVEPSTKAPKFVGDLISPVAYTVTKAGFDTFSFAKAFTEESPIKSVILGDYKRAGYQLTGGALPFAASKQKEGAIVTAGVLGTVALGELFAVGGIGAQIASSLSWGVKGVAFGYTTYVASEGALKAGFDINKVRPAPIVLAGATTLAVVSSLDYMRDKALSNSPKEVAKRIESAKVKAAKEAEGLNFKSDVQASILDVQKQQKGMYQFVDDGAQPQEELVARVHGQVYSYADTKAGRISAVKSSDYVIQGFGAEDYGFSLGGTKTKVYLKGLELPDYGYSGYSSGVVSPEVQVYKQIITPSGTSYSGKVVPSEFWSRGGYLTDSLDDFVPTRLQSQYIIGSQNKISFGFGGGTYKFEPAKSVGQFVKPKGEPYAITSQTTNLDRIFSSTKKESAWVWNEAVTPEPRYLQKSIYGSSFKVVPDEISSQNIFFKQAIDFKGGLGTLGAPGTDFTTLPVKGVGSEFVRLSEAGKGISGYYSSSFETTLPGYATKKPFFTQAFDVKLPYTTTKTYGASSIKSLQSMPSGAGSATYSFRGFSGTKPVEIDFRIYDITGKVLQGAEPRKLSFIDEKSITSIDIFRDTGLVPGKRVGTDSLSITFQKTPSGGLVSTTKVIQSNFLDFVAPGKRVSQSDIALFKSFAPKPVSTIPSAGAFLPSTSGVVTQTVSNTITKSMQASLVKTVGPSVVSTEQAAKQAAISSLTTLYSTPPASIGLQNSLVLGASLNLLSKGLSVSNVRPTLSGTFMPARTIQEITQKTLVKVSPAERFMPAEATIGGTQAGVIGKSLFKSVDTLTFSRVIPKVSTKVIQTNIQVITQEPIQSTIQGVLQGTMQKTLPIQATELATVYDTSFIPNAFSEVTPVNVKPPPPFVPIGFTLPSLFSSYQPGPGYKGKKIKRKYAPSLYAREAGIYGPASAIKSGGGIIRPMIRSPKPKKTVAKRRRTKK